MTMKLWFAAFAAVLGLSACGGGGGSGGGTGGSTSSTTPPPPTASVQSYSPANGATNVAASVTPSIVLAVTNTVGSNGGAVSFLCNSQPVIFTPTGSLSADQKTVTVSFVPKTALPAESCTVAGNVITSGLGGSVTTPISMSFTVGGTGTTATVLHYTQKVYALWTGKYPYAVTKTGVTQVANMTQYASVGGSFPLLKCVIALPSARMADGTIPVLCEAYQDSKYHELYVDPSTDTLHVFTGALPAALAYTLSADGSTLTSIGPGWGDTQAFDPNHPTWGSFAQVTDGWFFTLGNGATFDPNTGLITEALMFQDNSGNVSVVDSGIGAGTVDIMATYSN